MVLSNSIRGLSEDVSLSSVLMVGASRRPRDAYLHDIDRSKLSILLSRLGQLSIPVSDKLEGFKNLNAEPCLDGVVKPLDLNHGQGAASGRGGVDFYDYNAGDTHPDCLVFCGIPKYPDDHGGEGALKHLFSRSDYHHDENNWYNLRQKIQELSPKIVFCAGGDDCYSWHEVIGPGYIALHGPGLDNGLLISRDYLEKIAPKLIEREVQSKESIPLLDCMCGNVPVYKTNLSYNGNKLRILPEPQHSQYLLWPPEL